MSASFTKPCSAPSRVSRFRTFLVCFLTSSHVASCSTRCERLQKPMKRLLFLALGVLAFGTAVAARRHQGPPPPPPPPPQATPTATPTPTAKPTPTPAVGEEGIAITHEKTKTVCGDCHKTDDKGRMSRISFRRTTPEGWQETIRRMVMLNKAEIEPADAREIVKYL